ncbi:hypothetical protein [Akkermansia sp.]|uniref:hypothetical protein n=1 Tax=Akkermansia sp. TaxID=1872421 RepID=UPI0025B85A5E|nr:hypothetical protein [Akkermansia sp.]MCC8147435.1 hypothetical protein [Akkermansia sp.]
MKKYSKLAVAGTISCLMFTVAYSGNIPELKIITDGEIVTCMRDGKVFSVRPVSEKLRLAPDQKGSRKNPVVIDAKEVNKYEDLQNIQCKYLAEQYPGYEWIGPNTTKEQEQFLQKIDFKTKDGKLGSIFFDVTECFKKLKKNERFKKEIEFHEQEAIKAEEAIKRGCY